MGSIRRLPESVRNTMRSEIMLFDLTRVVEELVFNSLDAGASKVYVYVGVGTCYVKVVDDGCGISREGLELLGQRYVTSKMHHLADTDITNRSFGFRGEALASISDVSFLDIVTKASGRPNGYRKVIKGSKCLYLGIHDDRKDVGTTVSVRDLFYNQPVRRKYMQSSPKKVLHSVRKCVLRIALVHPKISFKVVDIESEDELFHTSPSSTLSLSMSCFGIQDSSSLLELSVSDGVFTISGFVSRPSDSFATKVLQYVYINSRFICKGPIHKLLNHLATTYEYLDAWKGCSLSQKGKRKRPQNCLVYIVNISCPSSLYDLTFEPSKTYVEFKDWSSLLAFVEKSVQRLWEENAANDVAEGSLHCSVDMVCRNELWKESDTITSQHGGKNLPDLFDSHSEEKYKFAVCPHKIQNYHSSCHLSPSSFNMLSEEVDNILNRECDGVPLLEPYINVSKLKEKKADVPAVCQSDSFQLWDGSFYKCFPKVIENLESPLLASDDGFLCSGNVLEQMNTVTERYSDQVDGCIVNREWQNATSRIGLSAISGHARNLFSLQTQDLTNESEVGERNKKPFLQRCPLQRSQPFDSAFSTRGKGSEYPIDGYYAKRKRVCADEIVDILEVDFCDKPYDVFSWTLWQDKSPCLQKLPTYPVRVDVSENFDFSLGASMKSFLHQVNPFSEEKGIASSSSAWCLATPDSLFEATSRDVKDFEYNKADKLNVKFNKRASCWDIADTIESKCKFGDDIMLQNYGREEYIPSCRGSLLDLNDYADCQENYIPSCAGSLLDLNDYANSGNDKCQFVEGHLDDDFCLEYSDRSAGKKDHSPFHNYSKGHKSNNNYENRGRHTRHQDLGQDHVPRQKYRSHSAPPFYRQRRRFVSLDCHSKEEGKPCVHLFPERLHSTEAEEWLCPSYQEDLLLGNRLDITSQPNATSKTRDVSEDKTLDHLKCPKAYYSPSEGFVPNNIQEPIDSCTKWRNGFEQIANNRVLSDSDSQHQILDIYSGLLHIAGHSLVPETIPKNCLVGATVLQQVDKKFIPIIAGRILAIIDQHAADERIRLEELRQKVLSGEAKTVTYLEAEQELILPEVGYQLLLTYAGQVKEWGWLCNIHAQDSGTFKKNLNILHHQRPTIVTLLAVPCILGVDLSDEDLLEFLQQLAETDGSSTMPPSVLRVLNFKACRGAIMFGDSLLPSECALIVEELKKTSLCFQCAHGRPTTAPLVNLEALHKQIAQLGMSGNSSSESWHGLRRQEISLERAARRLRVAKR